MIKYLFASTAALAMCTGLVFAADKPFKFQPIRFSCDILVETSIGATDATELALVSDGSEQEKHIKEAESKIAEVRKDMRVEYPCIDRKAINAANAFLWSAIAIRQHIDFDVDERTTMNHANQLLETCVTDYYSEQRSAECETRLQDNIKEQVEWEGATPDPDGS